MATDIPMPTYFNWLENDEEFSDRAEYIQEVADDLKAGLLKGIEAGKESAIITYLKIWGKDRGYTERAECLNRIKYIESVSDLVRVDDEYRTGK